MNAFSRSYWTRQRQIDALVISGIISLVIDRSGEELGLACVVAGLFYGLGRMWNTEVVPLGMIPLATVMFVSFARQEHDGYQASMLIRYPAFLLALFATLRACVFLFGSPPPPAADNSR